MPSPSAYLDPHPREREDARVRHVRSGLAVPVAPSGRQLVARRLEAARVLAGRPSLRSLATATGMSYAHLRAIANAQDPLTSTDVRDLAGVLDVPAQWLREGFDAIEFSPPGT
jgi:hypothetical protein